MDLHVDGAAYHVGIERQGREWIVTIGPRAFRVEPVRTAAGWSVLVEDPRSSHGEGPGNRTARRSIEVALDAPGTTGFRAHVNGRTAMVALPGARGRVPGRASSAAAATANGARRIVAPMPGRVIRILVRPGDQVTARQPVVVLEAMKMQNDVRTIEAGRVTEVHAVEGALVEAGGALVTIAGLSDTDA